jgi:predicted NBD/HSP70 family sugar kinase
LKSCLRGIASDSLVGIGIADPGLVDSRRGVVLSCSTIPFWRDVPLKEIFEREFGLPVTVETHTRAKTVAERDAGESRDTMIYIDYGAGIGAGLVTDGRLLYGQTSGAGEFGHMHVVENETACNCGSFGCLEAVAGLRAVETRVRRAVADGGKTEVLTMAGGDAARISGWMVFEAASRGDKIAGNTVAMVGRYLGLGIANLVNLFNPGSIVLDWRLRTAGDALLDEITATVRLQALREFTCHLQIRYATQGDEAGLLGMARMALDEHMAIPALKLPSFLQETQ